MESLKKISEFVGRYMAVIVLIVAAVSLFSVWHNISGAVLAGIYRKWDDETDDK